MGALEDRFKEDGDLAYLGDYYEKHSVGSTRREKTCGICGEDIPKGSSHNFYKFYGMVSDFPTLNVCQKCEVEHKEELRRMKNNEFGSY